MTTPLDAGADPDPPAERRGLESYPEFLAYPIDPNAHETAVIPRMRSGFYQTPYSYPEAYKEDKAPERPAASWEQAAMPQPLQTELVTAPLRQATPEHSPDWPPQQPPRAADSEQVPPRQQQPPRAAASEQVPPHRQQPPRAAASEQVPPHRQQMPQQSPRAAASGQLPPRQHQQAPQQPPRAAASGQLPPRQQQAPQSAAWQQPASSQQWPQAAPQPSPQYPQSAPLPPPPYPHPQPQQTASEPLPQLPSPTPPPSPRPAPRPRTAPRAPGRRRAKRSLASTLWPFQAHSRPPARAAASARIRSRSTTATVYRKLRADRAAVFGGCTVVVLVLLAVFAPVVAGAFGVDPTTLHPELTDATFGPHGGLGGISWAHPLGVDQRMGRDILARLLFGARVSLLMAGGATVLSVGLGVALGVVSGYLGGRVDLVVMRVADVFLAFPLMLFALGLTGALSDQAFGLSGNALRVAIMIFVMGFFNWPYIARIVRAEVLSLRGRDFVDAARVMGASTRWILWRELMPNLMAPILVYATLLIPANIVFEAGLSALGIGLDPPASSWGQMMTDAVATVYTDPEYLIVPGMAVFITVLAFNLFGDGLRNATDPTAQ